MRKVSLEEISAATKISVGLLSALERSEFAKLPAALALGPRDRCFNIMPLFHIHGLIGAVASSLAAGASIFATPGFESLAWEYQTFVFSWRRNLKKMSGRFNGARGTGIG